MLDIYQEITRIIAEGGEAALVTIVSANRSTPRGVGAKMLVRADGSILGSIGGGSVEAQLIKESAEVIRKGQPQRRHFSLVPKKGEEIGMGCGGEMEVFIEPILPPPAMYIFGGGHVSLALAKIGKLLDFKIVVIDDRAEYATPERFPDADLVLAEDFDKAFSRLKIDVSSYIVIVTRGHITDEAVLGLVLGTPAKYIGMIGSKTKFKTLSGHLLAKGVSKELLDTVHTPVGLEIYAETPEEVAVSILAELVKIRRSPAP